jgi:hypothetical protein
MRPTKIFTHANVIKIKALAANGLGSVQIAHAIGSTPASVRNRCSKMKIRLGSRKSSAHNAEPCIISNVSEASFIELDRHARQREISVQILAALLLETIAKDDLFDAVLDDASYKLMSLLIVPEK